MYGNIIATKVMIIILLFLMNIISACITAKVIYSADNTSEGCVMLASGIGGLIASFILAIILVITGVL